MCNKRVSIAYAVKIGALPKYYLDLYSNPDSTTVRVYRNNQDQYFIEDPNGNNKIISYETYKLLNGNNKKHRQPGRKTK